MSRNIKVKNDSIKKGDMKTTAMVWMSLSPQNSHIGILTSNITVLEVGAFGRWLGYKGGTLMNGISVLIKDIPQSSCHWRIHQQVWNPEKGHHPTILGLPACRAVKNKLPNLWYFVRAGRMD